MNKLTNEQFTSRIRKALDASIEEKDRELVDRLAQMRSEALGHIPEDSEVKRKTFGGPVLGMATVAVIALVTVLVLLPNQKNLPDHKFAFHDFDILTSYEDLEMLQTDLEFYVWLEHELEAG